MDVVLVDAGGANIGSLQYAFARLGVEAVMSADAGRIRRASHVVLPGVGAAAEGMRRLREHDLADAVCGLTQPVLGVCLGMQLLFAHSEEGDSPCLGILPGRVERMRGSAALRVPHMGWNRLQVECDDPLLRGIRDDDQAYFVHSYAVATTPDILAGSEHGRRFAAVVRRDNFCGMQCHPERSGAVGARLLKNFLEL